MQLRAGPMLCSVRGSGIKILSLSLDVIFACQERDHYITSSFSPGMFYIVRCFRRKISGPNWNLNQTRIFSTFTDCAKYMGGQFYLAS